MNIVCTGKVFNLTKMLQQRIRRSSAVLSSTSSSSSVVNSVVSGLFPNDLQRDCKSLDSDAIERSKKSLEDVLRSHESTLQKVDATLQKHQHALRFILSK